MTSRWPRTSTGTGAGGVSGHGGSVGVGVTQVTGGGGYRFGPHLASSGTDLLRIDVELCGELTHIPPAVKAALYRVAQESVTNAKRHAHHATRVDVRVIGNPEDVRLTVSDNGARTATTTNASGYGLVGMTERVTLLGGTFTAGPKPDRGWAVEAVLPRQGDAT